MHVRRKFAEIVKAAGASSYEGADYIALDARRRIDLIIRVDSRFDKMVPETNGAA